VAAGEFSSHGKPLALAAQLTRLRQERGWTLGALAARSGLSAPFLSRLESGLRQPSLAALITLAEVYGVALSALIDPAAHPLESTVTRRQQARIRRADGLRYHPISGGEEGLRLNALHVIVPRRRRPHGLAKHDGEELLYVLSGTLNLTLDRQNHLLQAGDSAHFAASIPHRLAAVGERDAEVLLVSAAPSPADRAQRGVARRAGAGRPTVTAQACIAPPPLPLKQSTALRPT